MFNNCNTVEEVTLTLVHHTQKVWVDNAIPQTNEMRDQAAAEAAIRIRELTPA